MKYSSFSPGCARSLPFWVLGLLAMLLLDISGCGFRGTEPDSGLVSAGNSQDPTLKKRPSTTDRRPPDGRPTNGRPEEASVAEQKFAIAQKKEMEITAQLEQADKMLKGSNLEGALRLVQRIEQENSLDPNVTMRTSYLQAMIFNRMKDAPRRKEAMNHLLKSMQDLQNDPRFQEGFLDGQASQELIKISLEKAGRKYGN